MKILRPLARLIALLCLVVLCLPVVALIPGAFFDRGPGGEGRASLFPAALALLDPFTWSCGWNSTVLAAVVSALSVLVGTSLAKLLGPWRFWGRGALRGLLVIPLAVGPFVLALGLQLASDRLKLPALLTSSTGRYLVFGTTWEAWLSWTNLVLAHLFTGVVLVFWSTEEALRRVDPRWIEAGRAFGASKRRAWRELGWPNVRPFVARTAAVVFSLVLFEPGAPLACNLPRTLAFQAVEATGRADGLNRAVALALVATAICLIAKILLDGWGGPLPTASLSELPARRAGSLRSALNCLIGGGWALLSLMPIAGLILVLQGEGTSDARLTHLTSLIYYGLLDRSTVTIVETSAILGATVAIMGGLIAWASTGQRSSGIARVARPFLATLSRVPALAIGIGALVLLSLLETLVGGTLVNGLNPYRTPGALLILATLAAHLPAMARQAQLRSDQIRPELLDAALAFQASRRRARAHGRGHTLRSLILAATVAATSITPALVLSPTSDVRPIAVSVLDFLDQPAKAAAFGLVIVLVNLLGFAVAQDRVVPPRNWFRGP